MIEPRSLSRPALRPAVLLPAAAAALALVLLAAPVRARAQELVLAGEPLTPQRVEAILAGQGYVGISDLRRRGAVWVAEVAERNGRRFRAVVDGSSGEVSGLRQVLPPRSLRGSLAEAEETVR